MASYIPVDSWVYLSYQLLSLALPWTQVITKITTNIEHRDCVCEVEQASFTPGLWSLPQLGIWRNHCVLLPTCCPMHKKGMPYGLGIGAHYHFHYYDLLQCASVLAGPSLLIS